MNKLDNGISNETIWQQKQFKTHQNRKKLLKMHFFISIPASYNSTLSLQRRVSFFFFNRKI